MKKKQLLNHSILGAMGALALGLAYSSNAFTAQISDHIDESSSNLSLEADTAALVDSIGLQQSPPTDGGESPIVTKAKARRGALIAALHDNPGIALKVAIPQKLRDLMDNEVKQYVEEDVTEIEGKVTSYAVMGFDRTATHRFELETSEGKTYHLHFATHSEDLPLTGTTVKIHNGIKLPAADGKDHIVVADTVHASDILSATAEVASALGAQRSIFILVNFSDKPNDKPWTTTSIKSGVFAETNAHFFEGSYHQATLTGDVIGWYTINVRSNTCDVDAIATQSDAAARAAGVDPNTYMHKVYFFPLNTDCGFAGLAEVGTSPGRASRAWINSAAALWAVGHELGHNLGLWHANGLDCGRSSPIGNSCANREYADPTDLMGGSTGHFNATHKARIQWLDGPNTPPITNIIADGTFLIEPFETFTANRKALRILKANRPDGSKDYYYIEFRQPIGFDRNLNSSFYNGVTIHQNNDRNANSSHLLDMVPGTTSFQDAALASGKTFQDPNAPNGGVTITVNSVSSEGANVSIKFGAAPPTCVRANPTLTVSPSTTPWVTAGGSQNYTITLRNNDTAQCATSNFTFSTTAQAGVTASLNSPTLSVAPGQSSTVNLVIQSSAQTLTGIYSVQVKGTNSSDTSFSGTVTANLGVQKGSSCGTVLPKYGFSTPNKVKVQAGGSALFTITLKNNDEAGCPASTFNLKAVAPAGVTASLRSSSVTTSPGGRAYIYMTVRSTTSTPVGTYPVRLEATHASNPANSSSTAATVVVSQFTNSNWAFMIAPLGSPYTVPANTSTRATLRPIVWSENLPVSGALVKIKIRTPDGSVVTRESITSSGGTGRAYYPLNGTSLKGVYEVSASVTLSGVTKYATTSFTVK